MSVVEHNKMELVNKLTYLNNSMINIQKSINDILRNIEDIGATKIKVCIFLKTLVNYLDIEILNI